MMSALFSWSTLWWFLMILYVPACVGLIVIVLLQKGKGSGFAGAFGVGGGSETVFGPRAYKSLPVKMTYGMAAAFMLIAVIMSVITGKVDRGAAPELVAESETGATPTSISTGLDDLGLGSGDVGAVTNPAPVEDAPAEDSAPAEDTAPAEDAAPAEETPAEEAPAAEPAPEETSPAADETPADAAPAEEAPAEESPAEGEQPAPNNGR